MGRALSPGALFRKTAVAEEDIDPAHEVDRMLEEQEAVHLLHRRTIKAGVAPD